MSERLIIKNFLGINTTIEFNKINIIIGAQATGKSICAKLLYFFKEFPTIISESIKQEHSKALLEKNYLSFFNKIFPSENWETKEFSIQYKKKNTFIEIKKENKLKLNYSDDYNAIRIKAQNFLNQKLKTLQDDDPFLEMDQTLRAREFFNNLMLDSFEEQTIFQQIFIPAGRSFFSTLQANTFTLWSNNIVLDPFIKKFGSIYEGFKGGSYNFPLVDKTPNEKQVNSYINAILCGEYIKDKNDDYIKLNDGRKVKLNFASSGQQEFFPLSVILNNLLFLKLYSTKEHLLKGYTLYIEEPEAHLFPTAQKKIVELLSMIFNFLNEKIQIILTTHSPYILTSLNNLISAESLNSSLSTEKRKQLRSIIPESQMISFDSVSAYALDKGKVSSLKCKETKLINTNYIDQVSDELAIQFDKMLDLE